MCDTAVSNLIYLIYTFLFVNSDWSRHMNDGAVLMIGAHDSLDEKEHDDNDLA